jgi:HSP20 family protein
MTYYFSNPMTRQIRRMAQFAEAGWPNVEAEVNIPVDVRVEDDAVILNALIPGVKAEDLSIQIVNETVTIQGELKFERKEDENYLLQECPSGRFYRTLTLSDPMDSSKAEASLTDGVLTLRLPKAEEARPRTIKIVSK